MALWALFLLPLAETGRAADQPLPTVYIEATLHPSRRTIAGQLTLSLPVGDPRLRESLWFHLPPNRFLSRDPRGERRHLAPIPFAISYLDPELRDPWLPDGFSEGSIRIESVQTGKGVPLHTALADNPRLPVGYTARDGLLRVDLPVDTSVRTVVIQFETRLPHRVVDGWSETAWVLARWFPELARFDGGAWDLGVFKPNPVRYAGTISTSDAGWVATDRGLAEWLESGAAMAVPETQVPEKQLSVIYVPHAEQSAFTHGDIPVVSLHPARGRRIAGLSGRIVRVFLGHLETRFGLPPPTPGLLLVQADLPPDEMLTLGNVVIVSKDFAQQTPLIDRVYVGTLAQALGRIWFGETVWTDEDQEAWLPNGFSGYLALDFFEALYGWDARIHTITDWLSPRFRENYFESPVRGMIRGGEDAPLLISFTGYPRRHTALVAMHRKAPLVLRSLAYVVGDEAFADALGTFYRDFRNREAGHDEWQTVLQQRTGQELDWFFDQWFHHTPQLDYAIENWEQEPHDGRTRLTVRVSRTGTGRMPVVVRVTSEDGTESSQRISGSLLEEDITFDLVSPAVSIDLDPGEFLLEGNRRNNHSMVFYRVRPFFDWSKQREILVNLRGRAGGNAVDGNYVGLGVNVQVDVDNQVRFIPIYGERTGWVNYDVGWQHDHFLNPRLSLALAAERLGGLRNRSVQLGYRHDTRDDIYLSSNIAVRAEEVDGIRRTDDGRVRSQGAGDANNLSLSHAATALWNSCWSNTLLVSAEHAQSSYNSDFDYTLAALRLGQAVTFTPWHAVQLEVIRQTTFGRAPLQKQPLLGDPLVLRGYPRSFLLVNEQLAAARIEYHWTVTRAVYGREFQSRRIQLVLFQDIGKGWDNNQRPEDRPQRQDAGLGLEIDINVAGFVTFPARIEVAMPYNDPQYKTVRVVFFQALSFF